MKLTFRDLKQQKFVIEAEPSETIAEVKAKIEQEKGWEPSSQRLIYSGKILQDANTVASYNIEEKGFIVCMTQKPKQAPAAQSSTAAPSTPAPTVAQQTPAAPPAPAPSTSSTQNAPATPSPAPAAATTESARSPSDANAMALGPERAAAVANMESMGFQPADINRAMRAAFFNPERAVEYLVTGIPEHLLREDRQPQSPSQPAGGAPAPQTAQTTTQQTAAPTGDEPINLFEAAAQATQGGRGAAGVRGAGAGGAVPGAAGPGAGPTPGNLDFLRNNPQFQQLRQLVHQQPQMLEPILQQLGAGNPQLAQMITSNPEQFLQLLAEDDEGDAALPPGAQAISVTEEESEAIERLCRLGFERNLVIQAYFACDKNEELAANFLFDQPDDDEGQ